MIGSDSGDAGRRSEIAVLILQTVVHLEGDLGLGVVLREHAFRIVLRLGGDLALDDEMVAKLDADHIARRARVVFLGHAIDRDLAEFRAVDQMHSSQLG